jgi:probable rRNA maturation factor
MPVDVQCGENFPLSQDAARDLWQAVITWRKHPDDAAVVRCVSAEEIRGLNKSYRGKDTATNVLTFSYPGDAEGGFSVSEHDIVVSVSVVQDEAQKRGAGLADYLAAVLVHAFLHTTGMDHERSQGEAEEMRQAERAILDACGFRAEPL